MINFLLILLGILVSAAAQVMLKKAASFEFLKEFSFFLYFFLGGGFYVLSFGIYAYLLKIFNISKISPIMTVGTMLLVVLSGVIIFKEVLTIKQIFGIILGVASIVLIVR